jgi:ABC-type nitrate/sulfonate/bicarbonate transport system permease component
MMSKTRRIGSVVALLIFWQIAGQVKLAPPFLLPAPTDIVMEAYDQLKTGALQQHVVSSMTRMLAGFGLALVTGVIFGGLMG